MSSFTNYRYSHHKKPKFLFINLPNKNKTLKLITNTLYLILNVLTISSIFTNTAHAYDIEQYLLLSSTTEYDSNPIMTEKNKQSLFRLTLAPTYSFAKIDENQKINFDASLNVQRSTDTQMSADRNDPRVNFGWLYGSAKNQYNVNLGYSKYSTRFSELTESGFIQQDGSVLNKNISAGWGRTITERLISKINASYSDAVFTAAGLSSYTSKQINGNLSYAYSEYFSPYIQASISDYKTQVNPKPISSTNYSIGSTILVSERLDVNANVGLNHTSTAGNGWIALFGTHYKNEYSSLSATLQRSVNPTGLTDLQKTDSLVLNYTYDLSDLSAIGSTINFLKSDSITSNKVRQVDAFYSRTLSPQCNIRVILTDKNYETNTNSAHGNVLGFSLTYQTPNL
ncbi:MAG: hypothetical protein H7Z18_04045 [Methylophilaceae bacterium]|nr:hypothetical protein [Methylophilaceae bacterium]